MKSKTIGQRIKELFGLKDKESVFYEELEDILIQADIGIQLSVALVEELKEQVKKQRLMSKNDILTALKKCISSYIKTVQIEPLKDCLNIFLILGVNGVGKTTTVAKLAHYFKFKYNISEIVLSAADTFRAAAIDQLQLLGQQLKVKVIHQAPGADPGAVVFDSLDSAKAHKSQIVLVDTSGRMHNKTNLVRELSKIDKIIKSKSEKSFYHKILVIDATTGQNALSQGEAFKQALGVDSIILAKFDSSAKGGIAVSICKNLGIPFSFLGTGEKMDDIKVFNKQLYLNTLLGE